MIANMLSWQISTMTIQHEHIFDRHRPGHLLGKNIKLHEMKNEKKLHGFSYHKNMANFEAYL